MGRIAKQLELDLIGKAFPKTTIIDPGDYDDSLEKLRMGLKFCYGLIDKADGVVFSRLLGEVTAGVGAEVKYTLSRGKPVFELRERESEWEIVPVTRPVRYLNREKTRDLYRIFRATLS